MARFLNSFLVKIALVIFLYLLIYYFVAGATSRPWEGDSLDYHIPIANLIAAGHILNPVPFINNFMQYSPASGETFLAILMVLRIPLNLYNVFGLVALFFALNYLGKTYKLNSESAVIFAISFTILHGVIRWVLAQTIDIWLATFFALSLALLQNPKRTWKYFLALGAALGMVMGTKYTGPAFTIFLLLVYGRNIVDKLSFKNFLAFSFPFLLFGVSWYIRNYILTGDPYFPQSIPFFKGIPWHILDAPVWKMFLAYPKVWFDAFVSEYTVWGLALILVPVGAVLYKQKEISKLAVLGLLNFVIYFFLPSGPYPNLITSGFRYTYPAFIPLVLAVFLLAKKFGRESELFVIALTNMLILPELSYHPKILIALIPAALVVFYPSKIKQAYQFIQQKYSMHG